MKYPTPKKWIIRKMKQVTVIIIILGSLTYISTRSDNFLSKKYLFSSNDTKLQEMNSNFATSGRTYNISNSLAANLQNSTVSQKTSNAAAAVVRYNSPNLIKTHRASLLKDSQRSLNTTTKRGLGFNSRVSHRDIVLNYTLSHRTFNTTSEMRVKYNLSKFIGTLPSISLNSTVDRKILNAPSKKQPIYNVSKSIATQQVNLLNLTVPQRPVSALSDRMLRYKSQHGILRNSTLTQLTHNATHERVDTFSNSIALHSGIVPNPTTLNTSNMQLCTRKYFPQKMEINTNIKFNKYKEEELAKRYQVTPGGSYKPVGCKPLSHIAVLITYRDREAHLQILLYHLHPYLQRQRLQYTIFVVEQEGTNLFNKGRLYNAVFLEAMKLEKFECIIMHDVDLIPEDFNNLYTCPSMPTHLSAKVNTLRYRLPYTWLFGGVAAMSVHHFLLVDGYSNKFWGWGAEDDDMSNRIAYHGLRIVRSDSERTRYTMLWHIKNPDVNPDRRKIKRWNDRRKHIKDGLCTLKYEVKELQLKPLYTWLYVNIDD